MKVVTKKRRYKGGADENLLRYLFKCQLSEEEIAKRTGWGLPTVRQQGDKLKLSQPRKKGRPTDKPAEPPAEKRPESNAPMAMATLWFTGRLTEAKGSYRLDGTPIRFTDLMRRMNAEKAARGVEQSGHSSWRV